MPNVDSAQPTPSLRKPNLFSGHVACASRTVSFLVSSQPLSYFRCIIPFVEFASGQGVRGRHEMCPGMGVHDVARLIKVCHRIVREVYRHVRLTMGSNSGSWPPNW